MGKRALTADTDSNNEVDVVSFLTVDSSSSQEASPHNLPKAEQNAEPRLGSSENRTIKDSLQIDMTSQISLNSALTEDRVSTKLATNVLSIEEDDLQDFQHLQDDVKQLIGNDDSEWLRKPTNAKSSQINPPSRPTSFVNNPQETGNRNSNLNVFSDEYELQDMGSSNINQLEYSWNGPDAELANSHDNNSAATSSNPFHSSDSSSSRSDDSANYKYKPYIRLYGKSLGLISPHNPWRIKFASLLLHEWYKRFSTLVLLSFTIILSWSVFSGTTASEGNESQRFTRNAILTIVFTIFFTFEAAAKIIAFGFWDDSELLEAYGKNYVSVWELTGTSKFYKFLETHYSASFINTIIPIKALFQQTTKDKEPKVLKSSVTYADLRKVNSSLPIPRAFTRSSWGRLDLISTLAGWLAFGLSFNNFDIDHGLRLFKALMAFRILRLIDLDSGLVSILRALKYGFPELLNVGFMLLYFWVFFGILGVQTFRGSLKRQCVWFNPDDPSDTYQYDMQFCGGYLNASTLEPMNYIFMDNSEGPLSKGFLCPVNSKCISNANPYNGRISFDNIVNSMELIFVIMSANTFTDLMYYTMDSDNMATALFFIGAIFFLTVWMVNLLIAVLYSSFEIVHDKYKEEKVNTQVNYITILITRISNSIKRKSNATVVPSWSERANYIYKKIEWIFVLLIFISVCTLASVKKDSSEAHLKSIFKINQIISFLLLFETVLRLSIHIKSPWKFLATPNYVYDSLISIICVVLASSTVKDKIGQTYNWLLIFPITRFYRVVILFSVTRNLWKRVLKNAVIIWNLSAFYFLFVFLASLIILLYFEGTLTRDDMEDTPFGFYSLPNSFLTLFKIGSTENWTDSLYILQKDSRTLFSAFFGSMLLILWFILANFVVLNVFVAVIAASFDIEEDEKRPAQIKHYLKKIYPERIKQFKTAHLLERIKKKLTRKSAYDNSNDFKQFLFRGTAILSIAQNYKDFDITKSVEPDVDDGDSNISLMLKRILNRLNIFKLYTKNPFFKDPEVVFVKMQGHTSSNKKYALQLNEWEEEKLNYLHEHPSFNNTYFLFPPNHALRKFCQSLVPPSFGKRTNNKVFIEDDTNTFSEKSFFHNIKRDIFVFATFVATLLMVIYSCYVTPLYRINYTSNRWNWQIIFEIVFVPFFTVEFLIKTIADGLIYTPNAYLLNPWNRIDLVVLIALWTDFIAWLAGNVKVTRIIKAISALRALRFLTISNMARVTFKQVMFDGLSNILGACIVALSILFPYTVWGLGIFRGRLGVCNDGDLSLGECYNEFTNEVFQWNILMPRVYAEPILHLNSFPSAFRSMYEIVSLEGWTDLLENMMDSTGVGTPAKIFASSSNGVFLVLFNFISMVFILNLFVSFIVGNNARKTGSAFLTLAEKSWLEVKRLLSQAKPDSSPDVFQMNNFRKRCYLWAVEKKNFYFSLSMQFFLYLHIITLLSLKDLPHEHVSKAQDALFMITTSFLLLQEIMHIYGKGIRLYVVKPWNIFRIITTSSAFVTNIYQLSLNHVIVGFSNTRDIFQLAIFLFVIPQNDTLTELINTATASLPSIFSLIYTWFILFLVYAIALNQVFGLTKLGPNTTGNINCRTVAKTLILLFRCSFGEGWNYIMNDLTLEEPFCYSDDNKNTYTDCGSKPYAYALLMSWNILSMYIFVNMFISLIVEKFSYVYHREDNKNSPSNPEEIRKFKLAWRKYDPDGVGEIDSDFLPNLMHSIDGPLSFKIWEGRLSIHSLVKNYMIVNPNDPYDVKIDFDGFNNELSSIDVDKVNERRLKYRRFVQEARLESSNPGSVKFYQLIQQIPLYSTYNPTECLGIDEYVQKLYNINKVDKVLKNERNYDVLLMTVTRWKYLLRKRTKKPTLRTLSIPLNDDSSDEQEFRSPLLRTQEFNFMWSPATKRNDSRETSPDARESTSATPQEPETSEESAIFKTRESRPLLKLPPL